eukprot:TRINITY_DN273_c0_g1_i1.p1 TRINITY_DN273_c0_g1~~TRINITY_DN273_c0_g1_i1.p1  ORF type:complete len:304 (+),score=76.79 TRINITY_DN273_c0_g1_i1:49-960(+)
MAPTSVRTAALLGLGVLTGLVCSSAFVASPGVSQGSLRAVGAQQGSKPAFGASLPSGSSSSLLAACSVGSLLVAAAAAVARRAAAAKKELVIEQIPRPEDLLDSPKFPLYSGSTQGYMSKSTRERHAITWTAKEMKYFDMPTGGAAVMNKGENLCYFRKKEQCIALTKQLRKMGCDDCKVYRLKKDGTVVFMHPADGVFPEKVNKGRVQVNGRPFSAYDNPRQGELKYTKYAWRPYEADPLTTMFIRCRMWAFQDIENLFALPQPDMDSMTVPAEQGQEYQEEEYTLKVMEALKKVQEDRQSL